MHRMRQGRGGLAAAFVLGLLVAGAGTATAAKLITGKQIKDGSITARDLAKDVRSQLAKPGTAGPRGPAGPQGAQGEAGPAGAQGPAGKDGAAAGVQPAVRAAAGGAATIPTQDFVDAALSEEDFDTAAMHDIAANTADVVIPAAGTYQLAAGASWEANSTGIRLASIAVNNASDTLSRIGPAGGLEQTQQVLADVRRLQAGDVVRLRVRQTSGGDLHLMPIGTFLAVARIGP